MLSHSLPGNSSWSWVQCLASGLLSPTLPVPSPGVCSRAGQLLGRAEPRYAHLGKALLSAVCPLACVSGLLCLTVESKEKGETSHLHHLWVTKGRQQRKCWVLLLNWKGFFLSPLRGSSNSSIPLPSSRHRGQQTPCLPACARHNRQPRQWRVLPVPGLGGGPDGDGPAESDA